MIAALRRAVFRRRNHPTLVRRRSPASSVARLGENVAVAFLERRGARVVDRNLRVGAGEIDLLVSFGAGLVAVEVKTIGPTATATDPIERLTDDKLRQVRALVGDLNSGRGQSDFGSVYRIDFVGVRLTTSGAVINWRTAMA